MFTLLIILMSLIALGFVIAWWLWPNLRERFEAPKYHFLEQERRFEAAARKADPPVKDEEGQ